MSAPSVQQQLEAVENAIYALTTGGAVKAYSIGGNNIQKMDISELERWRRRLRQELKAQKQSTSYASFKKPT